MTKILRSIQNDREPKVYFVINQNERYRIR